MNRSIRSIVGAAFLGGVAVIVAYLACTMSSPKTLATQVATRPNNASLLKQPEYATTLQWFLDKHKFCGAPYTLNKALENTDDADVILFLRAMQTTPGLLPPYLLSDGVSVTPNKQRWFQLGWIGVDRSIPNLEVIGRGGQIVASFEGKADAPEVFAIRLHPWIRGVFLVPIFKGEQDAAVGFPGNSVKLHVDVTEMREIEGVRFVTSDGSYPRFVRATYGDALFAGLTRPVAPGEPQFPGTRPW